MGFYMWQVIKWILCSPQGLQVNFYYNRFKIFTTRVFPKNRGGPPKWMVYNEKHSYNGWFGGTMIFGNNHKFVIFFEGTWNQEIGPTKDRSERTGFPNKTWVSKHALSRNLLMVRSVGIGVPFTKSGTFDGWGVPSPMWLASWMVDFHGKL